MYVFLLHFLNKNIDCLKLISSEKNLCLCLSSFSKCVERIWTPSMTRKPSPLQNIFDCSLLWIHTWNNAMEFLLENIHEFTYRFGIFHSGGENFRSCAQICPYSGHHQWQGLLPLQAYLTAHCCEFTLDVMALSFFWKISTILPIRFQIFHSGRENSPSCPQICS